MVNLVKSKVMHSIRDGIFGEMNIWMDDQVLEEVKIFKYLGSLVMAVGGIEAEVQQRVLEESTVGTESCEVFCRVWQ